MFNFLFGDRQSADRSTPESQQAPVTAELIERVSRYEDCAE